ncbi:hypothetical protein ACEN2I_01650 [Flavobacterium sp. W22_SRS_FK3]|uniref:hypothetical protein n=1 Tax=Flavobacterium sp. W22_SRS_FK3 TaxID=3240275 RepID=UPI003F9352F6
MNKKNYISIALLLTAFFICSNVAAQATKDFNGIYFVRWKGIAVNTAMILIGQVDESGIAPVTVRVIYEDMTFKIIKAEYFSKLQVTEKNEVTNLLISEGKFSKFIKGEDLNFFPVSFVIQIQKEGTVGKCDFGELEIYSFENKKELQTVMEDFYKTDDPLYKVISSYIDKLE